MSLEMNTISWRDERIPRIVLGTVQLGMNYGVANKDGMPSYNTAKDIISEAIRHGINFFDTSRGYGKSEEVLGKVFKELSVFSSVNVISKIAPLTASEAIRKEVEDSLVKLGLESLWGFMLHGADRLENIDTEFEKVWLELREDGLVKYPGISVDTPEEADKALNSPLFEIVQIPCNAWDRRFAEAGIFEKAASKNKLCFVRSIYLQGLLLMENDDVKKNLPFAAEASEEWGRISDETGLSRKELSATFAVRLNFPLVIGAEKSSQIAENAELISKVSILDKEADEIFARIKPLLSDKIITPWMWEK